MGSLDGIEVRAFQPEDAPAAARLRHDVFSAVPWDATEREVYARDDRRMVATVDGRLVGHAAAWAFGQYFGGRRVAMAGIAGVAVSPEARGAGAAREMVVRLLARVLEQGDVISTLMPAVGAPYRRLGWGNGGVRWRVSLDPHVLGGLPAPAGVRLRPGTAADRDTLRRLYDAVAPHHDGWVDRSLPWWNRHVENIQEGGTEDLWIASDHDGDDVGYLHAERRGVGHAELALRIHDLIAVHGDAELALWGAYAGSWGIVREASSRGHGRRSLFLFLEEQQIEVRESRIRWLTRILDLAAAVAQRGYPTRPEGRVDLTVRDPLLAANDGPVTLVFSSGEAHVEPGGSGRIAVAIDDLSSLYTGYVGARELARLGRLRGADDADLALLEAAFHGPEPWMPDHF